MPTELGTLDAIHLASALFWRDAMGLNLSMATHDAVSGLAARAHGFTVLGGCLLVSRSDQGSGSPTANDESSSSENSPARRNRRALCNCVASTKILHGRPSPSRTVSETTLLAIPSAESDPTRAKLDGVSGHSVKKRHVDVVNLSFLQMRCPDFLAARHTVYL